MLRPIIIYLAGDREIHAPATSLDVEGDLSTQVAAAERLPIAPPPYPSPAEVTQGQVQLLRLDRVSQAVHSTIVNGPFEFVFLLTNQEDPQHRRRDTLVLAPLLERWCDERGHDFSDIVLEGAPHRLDGAGAQLLQRLDPVLSRTTAEVILVAGGGTTALQTSAHFAAFRGVQRRDQLTVVQLEEVMAPLPASPPGTAQHQLPRRTQIVDTHVAVVEDFHGVVGRRTLTTQARSLLGEMDLPGAAQLLRASSDIGVLNDHMRQLTETLLDGLTRNHARSDAVGLLSHAIDLAEVEWSRPGGSHLEAMWYAGLACVDLMPAARLETDGTTPSITVNEQDVNRLYRREAARRSNPDSFAALAFHASPMREQVLPFLASGPAELCLPGRTLKIGELCDSLPPEHPTGLPHPVIWAAMTVAYRQVRNQHAHELVTASREQARVQLAECSAMFAYAFATLTGTQGAHLARPIAPERLEELTRALETPQPATGEATEHGSFLDVLIEGTRAPRLSEAEIVELLADDDNPPERFALLPACLRTRTQHLITQLRSGPPREVADLQAQLSCEPDGLGALGLTVSPDRPTSSFRRLCRMVVPTLPETNQLLAAATELAAALDQTTPDFA